MADEGRLPWIDFGAVIAFLAPGFVVLATYLHHLPQNERWIDLATSKDQGLGSFFLMVLASLAVGLVVSGLRDLIIDWPLRQLLKRRWRKVVAVDWSKITKEKLTYLLLARDNFFRFYQSTRTVLLLLRSRRSQTPCGACRPGGPVYSPWWRS